MALALRGVSSYKRAVRADPGRLAVNLNSPIGFGAIIVHALLLHSYFEQSGVEGYVCACSPLYSSSHEDVLARFFERPSFPPNLHLLPSSAAEYLGQHLLPNRIDLAEAQRLYAQHFRPNLRLLDAVEDAGGGAKRFDLSVHYRGTDKFLESGRVELDDLIVAIDKSIRGVEQPQIFLATDDPDAGKYVRRNFPNAQFTSYDLGQVAKGVPRHFSALTSDEKALESLVNMHLLARAPVCIRTPSFLSAIAVLINPEMRTLTLNTSRHSVKSQFPELEIASREKIGTSKAMGRFV